MYFIFIFSVNFVKYLIITLEIAYNEIPCNKASLIRARHGSSQRVDDRPLFPHYYRMKCARI